MAEQIKDIALKEITPNPHNFRRNFSGPEFDQFVSSVRQKGVVQPILVRPKGKTFELVFGDRRFRAAKIVSKEKGGKKTIPAIVRELSDSEAYDLMVIENFHRDDLTEYEEARGFSLYLEKYGEEALPSLVERTGIKPAYIRRRVSVMKLPQPIIEAWERDEIHYGYLEQLARLDDEQEIMEWFEEIMDGYSIDSVADLKRQIDERAVDFKYAVFDLKAAGCLGCSANTDVQLQLFEIDAEKTRCLKPACFREKQVAWLTENWSGTTCRKKFKTTGFRFTDDLDRHQCNIFRSHSDEKPGKACFGCDAFITGFSGVRLNVQFERMCIGEAGCFKKTCRQATKAASDNGGATTEAGAEEGAEPRVAWHGEHFREIFFQDAIPQRFADVAPGEAHSVRLALFALVQSSWQLKGWFMKAYAGADEESCRFVSDTALFKPIVEMDLQQANEALKAATLRLVMSDEFLAEGRRLVADHIGIDLSREWTFTEEYLGKKHIPEILGMGERFGIFSDPKARDYLSGTLNKKDFGKCKKPELVKVFLESGVDLSGKVPDEILN